MESGSEGGVAEVAGKMRFIMFRQTRLSSTCNLRETDSENHFALWIFFLGVDFKEKSFV